MTPLPREAVQRGDAVVWEQPSRAGKAVEFVIYGAAVALAAYLAWRKVEEHL